MELSILALIVWGEITFLLAGGLFLLLLNHLMTRRKVSKSINQLHRKIKSERERRLEEIRQGLSGYGLDGEALEENIRDIDRQELKLYQRIANMFRSRSTGMLANVHMAVEASTKPYYQLGVNIGSSGSGGDADGGQGAAELEQLRESNRQLQEELSISMDTIGRMLNEYSSLFGAEDAGELDKEKIMGAFSVDENSEQAETEEQAEEAEIPDDELLEIDDEQAAEDAELDVFIDDEADEAVKSEADIPSDELLEIDDGQQGQDTQEGELEVVIGDETGEAENIETDIPVDELLEIDDEQPGADIPADDLVETGGEPAEQSAQEIDLDVVIDDEADESAVTGAETSKDDLLAIEDGLPEQAVTQADDSAASEEEMLLNAVELNESDVADLEAAGLTDIVDLETDLADELEELDVDQLIEDSKKSS